MKPAENNDTELISRFERILKRKGLTKTAVDLFQSIIYGNYRNNGRNLPWRETNNPYHILVSEIMLQQTQAERVIEKYGRFIETFTDFNVLADASLRDILKVWHGLGYNRRALALKKIAEIMVDNYNGIFPENYRELVNLPGIGKTTACEIVTFAFNKETVFIETNIRTVFIFFFFRENSYVRDTELYPLVEKTLDRKNPREWYYALMDYGVLLKKKYPGLNKISAHYHRQSKFEGSDRQIRGMILRELTGHPGLTGREIQMRIKKNRQRIEKVLAALQQEGFIRMRGDKFSIV